MFYAAGKHPLAGIGASFAGIAGAFAANYTPSAIDPVIQGFTQKSDNQTNRHQYKPMFFCQSVQTGLNIHQ